MTQMIWLVTGCSSGFGEQFVYSILERGDKVIATGRKLEQLRSLEAKGAAILQLDITSTRQVIQETIEEAIGIYGRIDVLVNNASYISVGMWEDLEYEDYVEQFNTNVFGTIKVTRAILSHFRQRREGTVVFIGSLSGWIGHPGCSAYAGSKFALEGIVESLRAETAELGINTLLIEPGRFRTKLLSGEKMKAYQSTIPDYVEFSETFLAGLAKEDQAQPGDPVKLVKIILDIVRGEGVAQGRTTPFRLPLGVDVYDDIKAKCEETLKLLEDWSDVIKSTDIEVVEI